MRYIDDAVVRQVSAAFTDSPAAGEFPAVLSVSWDDAIDEEEGRTAKRWWYLTDVQFSVVGLIDPTWGSMVTERVEYSPYGVPLYQPATDFDGDGDVDVGDESAFLDSWYAQFGGSGIGPGPASADRDRSGAVDVGDLFDILDAWFADFPVGGPGAPEGWISRKEVPPSMGVQDGPLGPDNPVGYCGYIHNPETGDYTVRFRHYSPGLGRWLERDPAGYVDGGNLFAYLGDRDVTMFYDPFGLCGCTDDDKDKTNAPKAKPKQIRTIVIYIVAFKDDQRNKIKAVVDNKDKIAKDMENLLAKCNLDVDIKVRIKVVESDSGVPKELGWDTTAGDLRIWNHKVVFSDSGLAVANTGAGTETDINKGAMDSAIGSNPDQAKVRSTYPFLLVHEICYHGICNHDFHPEGTKDGDIRNGNPNTNTETIMPPEFCEDLAKAMDVEKKCEPSEKPDLSKQAEPVGDDPRK